MKNKILEVQNYFINKITACEFEIKEFKSNESHYGNSYSLKILIDQEFVFDLWINSSLNHFSCYMDSFIKISIPDDRLLNLITLVESKLEDIKTQKIESLKLELEKLQTA